jgi:dTDP-4-amino-4,6-dideoxygalactose transaminase
MNEDNETKPYKPLSPIPLFKVFMAPDLSLTTQTLQSGMLTQGKRVEEFEEKLKEYFNYPYILTLNSATAGLTLALRLLNLPPNSKVLTIPLTCFASACAILENRLNIKWVDVDPKTCNIDLDDLERKISSNTSSETQAVLYVNWGGNPVDLKRLKSITKNTPVIQDCAHAFGASYEGKLLGTHETLSSIAVYSFQAIKHLTTGDGGIIILPNKELYDRAKLLRWFGISREKPKNVDFRLENDVPEWGYKFHMNDINASIGLCNLPHVNRIIEKHVSNAKYYNEKLKGLNGITLLDTHLESEGEHHSDSLSSCWLYTIRIVNKERFIEFMNTKNITVSQVHNRNDVHSCVKEFQARLPNMDMLEKEIICIPVGWWITEQDREYIVESIKEFLNNQKRYPMKDNE